MDVVAARLLHQSPQHGEDRLLRDASGPKRSHLECFSEAPEAIRHGVKVGHEDVIALLQDQMGFVSYAPYGPKIYLLCAGIPYVIGSAWPLKPVM